MLPMKGAFRGLGSIPCWETRIPRKNLNILIFTGKDL